MGCPKLAYQNISELRMIHRRKELTPINTTQNLRRSYLFGFQGQEKDDEIKGNGNSINYKFRMHDPRIGRFLSIDPLTAKYAWNSPYSFSENDVIRAIELEGLEKAIISHYNIAGDGTTELQMTTTYDNLGAGQWEGTKYLEQYNKVDASGTVTSVFTDFNEKSAIWQAGTADLKMLDAGVMRKGIGYNKEDVRTAGKILDYGGIGVEVIGYGVTLVAPEFGLPISRAGAIMSATGSAMQASVAATEGDFTGAVIDAVGIGSAKIADDLIDGAKVFKPVNNTEEAIKQANHTKAVMKQNAGLKIEGTEKVIEAATDDN